MKAKYMKTNIITTTAVITLLLGSPAFAEVVLDDNFDDLVGQPGGYTLGTDWTDGGTFGNWYANFLGYGTTEVINPRNSRIDMTPCDVDTTCPAQQPPIATAAALVTTINDYDATIGNGLEIEARTRLIAQLRDVNPNAWESPWILWNVIQDSSGLVTYANYFALKTNGWELGVITGNNGQIFLATGSTPTVSNNYKTVTIQQNDSEVKVWISGSQIDLNGAAAGKALIDTNNYLSMAGAVGLYTEDANVQFDDVLNSQL